MDRLPALIIVAAALPRCVAALPRCVAALTVAVAALAGCEGKRDGGAAPSRADVAKVGTPKAVSTEAFCDAHFAGDQGPAFAPPALTAGTLAPSAGWRWVNVWATWCKPCIEEMPRLITWRAKLTAAGHPFELAFVSVDETDADLAAYRALHPQTPASPRLADPSQQAGWFAALGLDASAPIPIHVFVAPSGHIRCARAGGVREQDYAAIERLFTE